MSERMGARSGYRDGSTDATELRFGGANLGCIGCHPDGGAEGRAAQTLRKPGADDAKRAEEPGKAIDAALKADRRDEAIARAEELLALRARILGPKHFETVNDDWRQKTLRRVAAMPPEDRVACQSAAIVDAQAETFRAERNIAQAQPLFEKALEIRRRVLTDDHPDTATSYNDVAYNLRAQGKYAWAQPLFEKALAIYRRAFVGKRENGELLGYWLGPENHGASDSPIVELDTEGQFHLVGRSGRMHWAYTDERRSPNLAPRTTVSALSGKAIVPARLRFSLSHRRVLRRPRNCARPAPNGTGTGPL